MSKLPNDPLLNISLQQLIQKIKSQAITCEEVTKIYLKRIELLNKKLHSYIYIDYEGAIKSASAILYTNWRAFKCLFESFLAPMSGANDTSYIIFKNVCGELFRSF